MIWVPYFHSISALHFLVGSQVTPDVLGDFTAGVGFRQSEAQGYLGSDNSVIRKQSAKGVAGFTIGDTVPPFGAYEDVVQLVMSVVW